MKTPNARLQDHAKSVHSQYGEDGIIEHILETIGIQDRWCVEFGAWDGRHLSNTFNLIEHHGYSAVLIEGCPKKFQDLLQTQKSFPKITPVNAFVGFDAANSLDAILSKTSVPPDFDLLSIDIDGNDYHIWQALRAFAPKAVCIEFNPSIPNDIEFVQPRDLSIKQGSSPLSLVKLANSKGYQLVATTRLNAFFVQEKWFPRFGIGDNSLAALRLDAARISYLFTGYDGTLFVRGHNQLPWHGLDCEPRIRQLPAFFRQYPYDYGKLKSLLFKVYKKLFG